MKRFEKPRFSTNSQPRTSTSLAKKDQKPRSKVNGTKPLNAAQLVSRVLDATTTNEQSSIIVNDSTTGSESSEVYDNVNVHYMDDANSKSRKDENLINSEEEEDESDNDSVSSSQGVSKTKTQNRPLTSKGRANVDSIRSRSRSNTLHGSVKKTVRSIKTQLSDFSTKTFEETKEEDKFEDALNSVNSIESEVEIILTQKIVTMETRIKELEDELREVATLEMSLYSVFPEHGRSLEKLLSPAMDLFRLYGFARRNQNDKKLISVTKNIVSALFLVLKSSGSDVSRLTFWLSNTVILREIISNEYGGTTLNRSKSLEEDWRDVRTLIEALKRVESCLFTKTVESIWSKVMMIHMRPQGVDSTTSEITGNVSEPATCDRLQESFSVNLWRKAFEEALKMLCPVKSTKGECGCLHVLNKMVMEQCIERLDVAMFNAILRESVHQIPTDLDSDPIDDPRVLPIPEGVLSFESGVKLKNTVSYWSRLLADNFEIDLNQSLEKDQLQIHRRDETFKPFNLLNELSDLLMFPKEMLVDSSTRHEVCPSIELSLIKRILCNFTPDEFCPYPVPGSVLEELNSQSITESSHSSEDPTRSFPRQINLVQYNLPSSTHLTDIVAELSDKLKLSMTQSNGYSSYKLVEESRSLPYYIEEKDDHNLCLSRTNERYRFLGET